MLAEEAIKNAPTDVLCEAAGTLQKAHDYVEKNTFNISKYGAGRGAVECCFIGSVRHVSGEHNVSVSGPARLDTSRLALLALDRAAITIDGGIVEEEWTGREAGGFAEQLGFKRRDATHRWNTPDQEVELAVYRQALREMHLELMSREDAGVPA